MIFNSYNLYNLRVKILVVEFEIFKFNSKTINELTFLLVVKLNFFYLRIHWKSKISYIYKKHSEQVDMLEITEMLHN